MCAEAVIIPCMGNKPGKRRKSNFSEDESALGWAIPGDIKFEAIKTGAAIVASGLSLRKQVQRLLEVTIGALELDGGQVVLGADLGRHYVVAELGDQVDLGGQPTNIGRTTHAFPIRLGDNTLGSIAIYGGKKSNLTRDESHFCDLMAKQLMTTLSQDPDARMKLFPDD